MKVYADMKNDNEITEESVQAFNDNGFLRIPGLLTPEEAARCADLVMTAVEDANNKDLQTGETAIFAQFVNLWTVNEAVKGLSMHPKLISIVKQLAGVPIRFWHDQALIKYPGKSAPTEWHQDEPFWPHEGPRFACAAWIALADVTVQRGCMSYIPGYQDGDGVPIDDLGNKRALFDKCPEMEFEAVTTIPLKAGDCTVHHCRTPHAAGANITEDPRIAHISCFRDAEAIYNGKSHVVTDGLGLKVGGKFDHPLFPLL